MSRTDKTAPWKVKKTDDALAMTIGKGTTVPHRFPKWWIGESRCGCPGCAETKARRLETRRQRRTTKLRIRDDE